jgi:glyceraldehyde-3-phosphate dehydrogenase/erythrose-4-phosphate dehydrogenase
MRTGWRLHPSNIKDSWCIGGSAGLRRHCWRPRAAVIDLDLTRVVDATLVKVMAWYDNEWGFTHQMIREARSILGVAAT